MTTKTIGSERTRHSGLSAARIGKGLATVGAAILALAACDSILDVEVPGDLVEEEVFTPANAQLLLNSAIADFECSYSMFSAVVGAMGDEAWGPRGGFGGAHYEYDTQSPATGPCTEVTDVDQWWWHGFERSRLFSERLYDRLANDGAWVNVADREKLMASAAIYAAMVYDILGSIFCEYAFPGEPLVPPSNVLTRGENRASDALAALGPNDYAGAATTSLKELAYLVRARIRRTLGDDAGASADAMMVSPGFAAYATRDGSQRGRWNEIDFQFTSFRYRTVAGPLWWYGVDENQLVSAGMWDLTIDASTGLHTVGDGVPDVRVPETYVPGQTMSDGVSLYHQQDIYGLTDPHRIASWEEAQLILAEIERGSSAVSRINAIRAQPKYNLPALVTSDADVIYSAIVEERRREFFLQGARHYMDKLRFGLWFPRGQGTTKSGEQYGFAYCLNLPQSAFDLNPNVAPDYEGIDLTNTSYVWELEISDQPDWPVPATLPQFDTGDPDAIPWTPW